MRLGRGSLGREGLLTEKRPAHPRLPAQKGDTSIQMGWKRDDSLWSSGNSGDSHAGSFLPKRKQNSASDAAMQGGGWDSPEQTLEGACVIHLLPEGWGLGPLSCASVPPRERRGPGYRSGWMLAFHSSPARQERPHQLPTGPADPGGGCCRGHPLCPKAPSPRPLAPATPPWLSSLGSWSAPRTFLNAGGTSAPHWHGQSPWTSHFPSFTHPGLWETALRARRQEGRHGPPRRTLDMGCPSCARCCPQSRDRH